MSELTYIFEPVFIDPRLPRESLVIHRNTGELSLLQPPPSGAENVTVIHGIMGILTLHGGDYLITITGKQKVATLNGHDIFKLTGFRILPITLLHRRSRTLFV
jgi:phosphatidylinositol 4-phosphatase